MSKRFYKSLERATDSTLVDPNWDAILECVDFIRGGEASAKSAVSAIQKRYHNENPHVSHHALLVLEACMKNCGAKFHSEVATKEFMEDLRNLAFEGSSDKVKEKILELLQCWAIAFKDKPDFKIVVDTRNLMKLEGATFPEVSEAEAMFIAESAPDWVDGDCCFRCRAAFGILTRKHHCRACGQIFCDKCSNNQSLLPRYGIEKEVRVCDGCFEKLPASKKKTTTTDALASVLSGTSISDESSKTAEQKAKELKEAEEYEFNLALAISQSEAEAKEQEKQRRLYQIYNGTEFSGTNESLLLNGISDTGSKTEKSVYKGAASTKEETPSSSVQDVPLDPELARYLNKDYWQKRKQEQSKPSAASEAAERRTTPVPTAPPPSESSHSQSISRNGHMDTLESPGAMSIATNTTQRQLDGDITPTPQLSTGEEEQTAETMEFCRQIYDEVTKMVNRINSNRARNRSLLNDTAIQSLWYRLTKMIDQANVRKAQLEEKKGYYESLMDKVSNIKYSRAAIDQLKEQYEKEEEERRMREREQKQREMQHTAALLRHQKHTWLQAQQREQMRRMLAQNAGVGYAGYYPTTSFPMAQPGMMPAQMQSAQPDSPYLQPGSPYSQYAYSQGMTQVPGAVQQPAVYAQVSQPGPQLSTSQQSFDARQGGAVVSQPYTSQMIASTGMQSVATYADPASGMIYTSGMHPQYVYAAAPSQLGQQMTEQRLHIPQQGVATEQVSIPQQASQPTLGVTAQQVTRTMAEPQSAPVLQHAASPAVSRSAPEHVYAQQMAQQQYPGAQSQQHQYPGGVQPQQQQQYPGAQPQQQQQYPGAQPQQQQQYPGAQPQQQQYPGAQPPQQQYPGAQPQQQQYPGAQPQAQYSGASLQYPGQQYIMSQAGGVYQMPGQPGPQYGYPQQYVPTEQYYPGMQAVNPLPQQMQTAASPPQPKQEGVVEGALISFD